MCRSVSLVRILASPYKLFLGESDEADVLLAAKQKGRELYSDLDPNERKERLEAMVGLPGVY